MPKISTPPTVLLVEDDTAVRRSLQLLLHCHGFNVLSFGSVARALAGKGATTADILIADYRMPDGDGLVMMKTLKNSGWVGRAILITGHPSPGLTHDALANGYEAVLEKPLRQHELVNILVR